MILLPIVAYGLAFTAAAMLHWISYYISLVFGFPLSAAVRAATNNMDSKTFDSVLIRFMANLVESLLVASITVIIFFFFFQKTPILVLSIIFGFKFLLTYLSWKKSEVEEGYLFEDMSFLLIYGGMMACCILLFFSKNMTTAVWALNG